VQACYANNLIALCLSASQLHYLQKDIVKGATGLTMAERFWSSVDSSRDCHALSDFQNAIALGVEHQEPSYLIFKMPSRWAWNIKNHHRTCAL